MGFIMFKTMLGNTGMEIGRVVFGGIIVMNEEQKDADRFVSYAVDEGVNYFDVAPTYGDSEAKLGPALKPYRAKVFLACKSIERTAVGIRKELLASLTALKTDYFDNYQLHALGTAEDLSVFEEDGALPELIKAKKEGFIKNISVTAHNEDIIIEALSRFDFATLMFPVNWALGLGKGVGKRVEEICTDKNIGFLGMKTLAHRNWRESEERVYPKSWCKTIFDNDKLGICALKYTLSCHTDAVIPPGNFDQFRFSVNHIEECINNPLNDDDIDYLKSMLPDKKENIFAFYQN